MWCPCNAGKKRNAYQATILKKEVIERGMILAGHYYKYLLHTNLQPMISSFMFSQRSYSTNVTWTSSCFLHQPHGMTLLSTSPLFFHYRSTCAWEELHWRKNNASKMPSFFGIIFMLTSHATHKHTCIHFRKEPQEQLSILNILIQSYQSLVILVSLAYWLCIAAVDTAMIVRQWKRGLG